MFSVRWSEARLAKAVNSCLQKYLSRYFPKELQLALLEWFNSKEKHDAVARVYQALSEVNSRDKLAAALADAWRLRMAELMVRDYPQLAKEFERLNQQEEK